MQSPTSFTTIQPKRADVTGQSDQVFDIRDFRGFIISGIENKMIAAIGTINLGSRTLQYLFSPRLHKNLAGEYVSIVGTMSNKIGDFALGEIKLAFFRSFVAIDSRSNFEQGLTLGADLTHDLRAGTYWADVATPVACTSFPNYFPLYYGQSPVYGDVSRDEVRASFGSLGSGYRLWIDNAESAMSISSEVAVVVDLIVGPNAQPDIEAIKMYLNPSYVHGVSLDFADVKGPCGTLNLVPPDEYPQEEHALRAIFQPAPQIPLLSPQGCGQFTLALPSDQGKDAEADKGIKKLFLFHIAGEVDFDLGTVTNVQEAVPSEGMSRVLALPRAARAQSYADLLTTACEIAADHDAFSLRSSQVSLKIIQKVTASNLLSGNFATQVATSVHNESSSVDLSVFLPQVDVLSVTALQQSETNAKTESLMEIADTHRTKQKVGITRIGSLTSMDGISKLCVNIDIVVGATVTNNGPVPVLRQICLEILRIVHSPKWKTWIEICGSRMQQLHWKVYDFLENIWCNMAKFATNYINSTVVGSGKPLTELQLGGVKDAVLAIKCFRDDIARAQASSNAIDTTNRYSCLLAASTASKETKKRDSAQASSAKPYDGGDKRVVMESSSKANASSKDTSGKKSRRGPKADAAAPPQSDRGMFFVHNPSLDNGRVFPSNLSQKICPGFTCKGKECMREQCDLVHITKASALTDCDILAIANHFDSNNVGWFNAHYFENLPVASNDKVKKLLGNSKHFGQAFLTSRANYQST